MTPTPITGTTAGWNVMASVNGIQVFCQQYRHHAKGTPMCHWGSRMLKRLVETSRSNRSKSKRISPGQQQLPFAFDLRLNQIPDNWHQVAVRFRRANGIRDGDKERCIW